jgi:hypothetical protein
MPTTAHTQYTADDIATKLNALFIDKRGEIEQEIAIHLLATHREAGADDARACATQLCELVANGEHPLVLGPFYGLESDMPQCNIHVGYFDGGMLKDLLGGIDRDGSAYIQSEVGGARRPDAKYRLGIP